MFFLQPSRQQMYRGFRPSFTINKVGFEHTQHQRQSSPNQETLIQHRASDDPPAVCFSAPTYLLFFPPLFFCLVTDYFHARTHARFQSRFTIDLYEVGCEGEKVATLCDKPTIGCRDSAGDYPVTIPASTIAGECENNAQQQSETRQSLCACLDVFGTTVDCRYVKFRWSLVTQAK